jgi:hypothetical protein
MEALALASIIDRDKLSDKIAGLPFAFQRSRIQRTENGHCAHLAATVAKKWFLAEWHPQACRQTRIKPHTSTFAGMRSVLPTKPARTEFDKNWLPKLREWFCNPIPGGRDDVDFERLVLHVRRSVVAMVEGAPKTEASQKEVPLDAQLAEALWQWEQGCHYTAPGHWGVCLCSHKGQASLLAGDPVALLRSTGDQAGEGHKENHLSHLSAHVWNAPQCQWREFQGGAGTVAPCESERNHRRIHAGGKPAKREAQSKLVRIVMDRATPAPPASS